VEGTGKGVQHLGQTVLPTGPGKIQKGGQQVTEGKIKKKERAYNNLTARLDKVRKGTPSDSSQKALETRGSAKKKKTRRTRGLVAKLTDRLQNNLRRNVGPYKGRGGEGAV